MSTAIPKPARMTPEEYLAWEREQVERHEFYDGEVFLRASGVRNHGLIGMNIAGQVGNACRIAFCKVI